ncbi:MAG: hypothetical protein ACTSUB_01355 [Candidatus Thorarchaeota archaeon]
MTNNADDIVRRDFQHGRLAYGFTWNRSNHERIGNTTGDSASLWAHLSTIHTGKIPETPFIDPFYTRASSLKFKKMSLTAKVRLRKKLERNGTLECSIGHDVVKLIRQFHKDRSDNSYRADHSILSSFLTDDEKSIALEIPVWSERYRLSGHIDLIRIEKDVIHVCDYKPGTLETTSRRFINSIPQVAAYGEMMTHHIASTLRSALESPLLPQVKCCIFDTHSAWHFGSELFVTLEASGTLNEF